MAALRSYARFVGVLIAKMAVIGAAVLALSAVYCVITGGLTAKRFASTGMTAGLLTTALGAVATGGSARLATQPTYQAARTASAASGADRARQDFQDSEKRIGFTWLMLGGGVVAMLAAYGIGRLLVP
ncbi:MAG: hypothetical protein IT318_02055 [Anaerolineales bacterium]|nr:hypothetical protein [Anaerolineales bacterium]